MGEHFDTVIIGAGLSGIGAACHLRRDCPGRSFTVLEARARMGGTWDLFRYPGIRSDSDMHTLGYDFKPWTDGNTAMDWQSGEARWHLTLQSKDGQTSEVSANFIISAAGYYNYDEGHTPNFEGREEFKGDIIHPQHWPENYDVSGKRIVVIGSGATAVTLVPNLAKTAQHVTMLQRSPTWIASRPDTDWMADIFRKLLPEKMAYKLTRAKNIAYTRYVYNTAQKKPKKMGDYLLKQTRKAMGPDYDIKTHFTPRYNPWDQRLCLVPNGDLFDAINAGTAEIVTDHIERFTPEGILLKSGETLPADLIVTATGLKVVVGGQAKISIDGAPKNLAESFGYYGLMFSDIPNLVSIFGYTNASWTAAVA